MGLGSELFALLTQSLQPGSCKKLSNETAGEKHSARTLLKKKHNEVLVFSRPQSSALLAKICVYDPAFS